MFEFHDPCESCCNKVDSPACKECKYNEDNWAMPDNKSSSALQ